MFAKLSLRRAASRLMFAKGSVTACNNTFTQVKFTSVKQNYIQANSFAAAAQSTNEATIVKLLQDSIKPAFLRVFDISGGCGASFEIYSTFLCSIITECGGFTFFFTNFILTFKSSFIQVVSDEFAGKTPVKQHRMVMDVLKHQFKDVHAMRLHTKTLQQFETDKKNGVISEDI